MTTQRDPDRTRESLVEAAFWEIFRHGFQAASLDSILAHAKVTKGALYHHFRSKKELGYAVVDELIRSWIIERWVDPVTAAPDPIDGLIRRLERADAEVPPEAWELGCPLNNLAQEMSPLDEGFRARIRAIYQAWEDGTARALRRGQEQGQVRPDIDPEGVASMFVASFEGAVGLAKNAQDPVVFHKTRQALVQFLEGLRARQEPQAA